MTLAAVVAALKPVVAAVSGIGNCYPRIPETKPTDTTFAVIETPSGLVMPLGADFDKLQYTINVYVMTKRNGDLWAEQLAVLPFADSIPVALRSAFTLGGLTRGTRYADPAWELIEAQIDDQAYIGLKFGIVYEEKATQTFSG